MFPFDDMVLTPAQAAAHEGTSVDTIRRRKAAGTLPFVQISAQRWGVRLSALKAVQTQTTPAPLDAA